MSSHAMATQLFTVFLCSPGDVAELRSRALLVLGGLQRRSPFLGRVALTVVAWDDPVQAVPSLLGQAPQLTINDYKQPPSRCDLTVVLLWSRLGTPLPRGAMSKPDGLPYASGTEWEIEDALRAGKPVLAYWWQKAPPHSSDSDAAQRAALEAFIESKTRDEAGAFTGGVCRFDELEEFEQQLASHVEQWLHRQLAEQAARASSALAAQAISQRTWGQRWRQPTGFEKLAAAGLVFVATWGVVLLLGASQLRASLERGRRAAEDRRADVAFRELAWVERGARWLFWPGLRGEALFELGKLAVRANDFAKARADFDLARQLFEEAGRPQSEAQALHELGNVAYYLADIPVARVHYELARTLYDEVVRQQGPQQLVAERANLTTDLATLHMLERKYGDAERGLEEALALARGGGELLAEANALRALGELKRFEFEFDTARGLLERARSLYAEKASEHGRALVLMELGRLDVIQHILQAGKGSAGFDHRVAALQQYREARGIFQALGLTSEEEDASDEIAKLRAQMDGSDPIDDLGAARGRTESRHGEPINEIERANALHALGQAYLQRGQFTDAAENLDGAAKLFERIGDPPNQSTALLALSEVHLRLENWETAESTARGVLGVGVPQFRVMAFLTLLRLEFARGQPSRARAHAQSALVELNALGDGPQGVLLSKARPMLEALLKGSNPSPL